MLKSWLLTLSIFSCSFISGFLSDSLWKEFFSKVSLQSLDGKVWPFASKKILPLLTQICWHLS
jgi:hypothetical protein